MSEHITHDICRAPEQTNADFGVRGPHTDVWSFATCVLHLATGQFPYKDLTPVQMLSVLLQGKAPAVPDSLQNGLQSFSNCASALILMSAPV